MQLAVCRSAYAACLVYRVFFVFAYAMQTVTYYEDSRHSWSQRPLSDVQGIKHLISSYSYMDTTNVYLNEEDQLLRSVCARNVSASFSVE